MDNFSFVQHIADNADHNICTLGGNRTLHKIAIIAAILTIKKNISGCVAEKGSQLLRQLIFFKNLTCNFTITGAHIMETGEIKKFHMQLTPKSCPKSHSKISIGWKLKIQPGISILCASHRAYPTAEA